MAEWKNIKPKTERQNELVSTFLQVTFMDRFKISYDQYLDTPAEFVNNAVTIIWIINEKEKSDQRKKNQFKKK